MNTKTTRMAVRAGAGALALGLLTMPAHATEGYFAIGSDAVARGQGGAGVAAPGENAMASAINPAAVAGLGNEFSLGLEAFAPSRGYSTSTAPGFVAPGSVRSGHGLFPVPNFALNKKLANGAVLNIAAYGNGGMNTSYPDVVNPNCGGGSGVFCMGKAGVDLSQLFLSVTYAKQSGNISWGVSPTIVGQAFKAWGLGAFSGLSSDPTALTDNGYAYSLGYGLRAGLQAELSPQLSFGISAQTKMKMGKFNKYAGLFAGAGSFDIPASATVGIAYKVNSQWTVMADIQRIWYSGIPAVANPYASLSPLGAPDGPGFGWKDVSVVKLGAVWKQSDKMTWRFGYAHSTNPVTPMNVTINILAPGVVTNHFTVGGTYKMSERDSLDFALVYAPKHSVTGPELTASGPTGRDITLDMHQFEATVGWTRKF